MNSGQLCSDVTLSSPSPPEKEGAQPARLGVQKGRLKRKNKTLLTEIVTSGSSFHPFLEPGVKGKKISLTDPEVWGSGLLRQLTGSSGAWRKDP